MSSITLAPASNPPAEVATGDASSPVESRLELSRRLCGVSPWSQMQFSVPHWHQAPLPTFECPANATVATEAEFLVVSPGTGENHIGRVNMQVAAKRNRILTTVSSLNRLGGICQAVVEREELYQHIVTALTKGSFKTQSLKIGDRLITLAEHALGMRETQIVEQVGQMLMNIPLPQGYFSIGQYYKALSLTKRGDISSSTAILEQLAASPATPIKYRARALKAIGGNHLDLGNFDESLRFFLEACRAASPKYGGDLLTATLSPWMIAVLRSIDGDHKRALEDLENLSPFVHLLAPVYPRYYYFYANALAVEWGEAGRLEEARQACLKALASPYADVNPEWHETAKDISQKAQRASHSVVALSGISFDFALIEPTKAERGSTAPHPSEAEPLASHPRRACHELDLRSSVIAIGRDFFDQDYPLPLNTEDHAMAAMATAQDQLADSSRPKPYKEPVSFLPFPNRFDETPDSPNISGTSTINPLHFCRMSVGQKRALVIEVAKDRKVSGEILDRMLEAAGVIGTDEEESPVYLTKTINLERRSFLEELISIWVESEIGPDDFAAVMSALRDCQDEFRLSNLIDQMISYSFHATTCRIHSEEDWRRELEALPEARQGDDAFLKEQVSLWVNGEISPESFAAALVVLRDCKEAPRRRHLLDQMIGWAYRQVPHPMESEREWRKRVEACLENPPLKG